MREPKCETIPDEDGEEKDEEEGDESNESHGGLEHHSAPFSHDAHTPDFPLAPQASSGGEGDGSLEDHVDRLEPGEGRGRRPLRFHFMSSFICELSKIK